jgi:hypothetical protein
MLKTTPLVVTIGLSLTIPFAVLGDLSRGKMTGGTPAIIGAVLVLASFGFMGIEGARDAGNGDEEGDSALGDDDGEEDGERDVERGRLVEQVLGEEEMEGHEEEEPRRGRSRSPPTGKA